MGVKPVEYIKDSSTQGFAVAGDEKVITKQNANTIKKDVDQGNTEDLDNGQERYLEQNIDYDNIEYSEDENRNVGRNQIDTTGEDGEDLSEKDGKGGAIGAAAGASVGAAGAAIAAGIAITISNTACNAETQAKLYGTKFPGAMLAVGILATVGGALAYALSFENTFDPNLGERKNQTSQAESTDQIIQQYYDELTANMDSMGEESTRYAELCELQLQSDVSLIDQIGELQAQIIEYRAQGNEEKVAELQKQIEELQKGAEEDTGNRDEMGTIKDNLELYASRNAEAQGVSESGDIVSKFLQDGEQMKKFAKAAQIASYVGVAAMGIMAVIAAIRIGKDLSKIFTLWAAAMDAAGLALVLVGGVMMSLAAKNFGKRAGDEGAAGDAGNKMAEYVASLYENIDAQAGLTEETGAGYVEADGAAAEEVTKTQEGVDKANTQLAKSVGGNNENGENPTTSPDGGSGNGVGGDTPDDKPDNNQPDGGNNPTT